VDIDCGEHCFDVSAHSKSGDNSTKWLLHRFYGYDQGVFGNVIINENFLETFGYPSANMQVRNYYRAHSPLPAEPLKLYAPPFLVVFK
jgi:hypothetical protein